MVEVVVAAVAAVIFAVVFVVVIVVIVIIQDAVLIAAGRWRWRRRRWRWKPSKRKTGSKVFASRLVKSQETEEWCSYMQNPQALFFWKRTKSLYPSSLINSLAHSLKPTSKTRQSFRKYEL